MDQPLITTPPRGERKPKQRDPEPSGYIVKKDTTIAGVIGLIRVEAYKPIRDLFVIHRLKAAGVELEPIFD